MWLQLSSGATRRRCNTALEVTNADGRGRQASRQTVGFFPEGPSGKTELELTLVSRPELFFFSPLSLHRLKNFFQALGALFAPQKEITPEVESDKSEHLEKLGQGYKGQMFSSRHDTACSPHALPVLCCCLTLPIFPPGQLNTLAPGDQITLPHQSGLREGQG